MTRFLHSGFWLPLLLTVSTLLLAPVFRSGQPPLQSHALALLLSGTVALSVYLFAVIVRPETF